MSNSWIGIEDRNADSCSKCYTHEKQGCESICEKKSELIWNAYKDAF